MNAAIRRPLPLVLILFALVCAPVNWSMAQTIREIKPPNLSGDGSQTNPTKPAEGGKTVTGSGSGSTSVGATSSTRRDDVKTVRMVVSERMLGRPRTWTSSDGRSSSGILLAQRQDPAQSGQRATPQSLMAKIEVIRDEAVRLKIGTGIYDVKLKDLSKADRDYIKVIVAGVAAHNKTVPAPTKPVAKPSAPAPVAR